MPIIHMARDEADARASGTNVRSITTKAGSTRGELVDTTIWLYDTHVGLCIREYEHNGYHDSDFFMVVWNAEKAAPETIEFASTRGWSYPCLGSAVDATPEVLEAYWRWTAEQQAKALKAERHAKAERLAGIRRGWRSAGLPAGRLRAVRREVGTKAVEAIVALYGPRIRSGFKLRLRSQVDAWAAEPKPKYPVPLSRKQLACLVPEQ